VLPNAFICDDEELSKVAADALKKQSHADIISEGSSIWLKKN
jgi:hypothetical protein